tara:strand:+ start:153 stop:725 length:573 start_codon:yes stop_codon:yes gene_type:complete
MDMGIPFLSISLIFFAIILIGGSIALGVYFIVKATQPPSIDRTKKSLKNINTVKTSPSVKPKKISTTVKTAPSSPSVYGEGKKIIDDNLKETKINQGIILFMEYHTGQFLLDMVTPKVEINSKVYDVKWGANQIGLDEGKYSLKAYYPYMGGQCGVGYIDFTLDKNEVKKIRYHGPLTVFQNGKVEIIKL